MTREHASTRHLRSALAVLAVLAMALGAALSAPLAAVASASGSISGTVTGSDAPGVGLSDANVVLTLPGGTQVAYTSTDADGHYSFTGLRAASYTVAFEPNFGSGYVVQQQWWNGASSAATATPIVIAAGAAVTGIDAAFPVGGAITGTVSASTGQLFGGTVSAIWPGGAVAGYASIGFDGTFRLVGLAAGSYTVGYSGGFNGAFAPQWWSGSDSLAGATYFPVTPGETVTGKDAVLQPGATSTGTISGTITGAGTPVVFGYVSAVSPEGTWLGSASTGQDGTYTITGIPAGNVALHIQPNFGANLLDQWWSHAASQADAQYISVTGGSALAGYDADLVPGATISGTVTDAAHAPLANVSVSALKAGDIYSVGGTTDSDGKFTIPALRAGDYTVSFDASGAGAYAPSWWNGATSPAGATVIHVADGQAVAGINASLGAAGSVSGTVTGVASNGTLFPAANATVYVIRPDGTEATETYVDLTGTYTIGNIAPGKYTLQFVPQGDTTDFVPQWLGNKSSLATARFITVRAGKNAAIDLTMPSAVLGTSTPTITGSPIVGQVLHAHAGTWSPAGVSFSYQWSRNGSPISGATSSAYALTSADAASTLTVAVTGSKTDYQSATVSSAPTAVVTSAR